MRLIGDAATPRLMTIRSGHDLTEQMRRYTTPRLQELRALNLSGYVFKADSPSCGIRRVPVFACDGRQAGDGTGLFAEMFLAMFPLIPIEDEQRLRDRDMREQFLERVFACHRRQSHNPAYPALSPEMLTW